MFSPDVLKQERKNNVVERINKRSIKKGYNKSTKVSRFATGNRKTCNPRSSHVRFQEHTKKNLFLYVRNLIEYWNVLKSKGKLWNREEKLSDLRISVLVV